MCLFLFKEVKPLISKDDIVVTILDVLFLLLGYGQAPFFLITFASVIHVRGSCQIPGIFMCPFLFEGETPQGRP